MANHHTEPILVAQPFLPPLQEFNEYLEKIWKSKWVTNRGAFHQQFEDELASYLGVPFVSVVTNGMLALMVAIQSMEATGEVITTPYSFVATTHAIWLNRLTPVFADIEIAGYNIDPVSIEKAITKNTSLILPVHVYGIPCNVDAIERISKEYNIPVIYDAAHAFGVEVNGNSILNFGDLSILSFHATKVFNTFEGGAIISQSREMKQKIDDLINFGIQDEVTVVSPGLNAKMNEIQAALGLLHLKYFDQIIDHRKRINARYILNLSSQRGVNQYVHQYDFRWNYAYFPILIEQEFGQNRDAVYEKLKEQNIYARRYFYPLLSSFNPYNQLESAKNSNLSNANSIAQKILCLPIHTGVNENDIDRICDILLSIRN